MLWAALAFASACDDPEEAAPVCTPEGGLEMYEKRIAPLLEENRPSSCNQCHLSGIDLPLTPARSPLDASPAED